jgi:hypothetical protein
MTRLPSKMESDTHKAALKLISIFPTQNTAADACGISRARLSHMVNGNYGEVAMTTTDLAVMQVIYAERMARGKMTKEVQRMLDQFERELATANQANQALTRTARKVSRMIERL